MDRSHTRDEALQNAILATECYMKALALTNDAEEKVRLRSKCKVLISRAESIKSSEQWVPNSKNLGLPMAPTSDRCPTREEAILLLESSRLHGQTFPPWEPNASKLAALESSVAKPFEYVNIVLHRQSHH